MRLQRIHTGQPNIHLPWREALWRPAMGPGWEGEAKSAGLPTKDLFQRPWLGDKWEGDFQVESK